MKKIIALVFCAGMAGNSALAENRVDAQRPDKPELAGAGTFAVGVKQITLSEDGRIDVLASKESVVKAPRKLTAEIWYPAADGTTSGTTYETVIRDGVTSTVLHGLAARDAAPSQAGPFPLVVVSHGYPGNRFLLAHLTESLASRGYVVVALDHTDSTYSDQAAFASTLLNRPLDQAQALSAMSDAGTIDPAFDGLINAEKAAVIGYSMGGYGALVTAGAGLSKAILESPYAPPHNTLAVHAAGSETHEAMMNPNLKAVIAIGPWGMNNGLWDANGLAGIRVPTMIMAGSMDTTSGYEPMRAIFTGATGTERHLLTFINAGHNAAAPIPAPVESYEFSEKLGRAPFDHYADSVWDTVRMNGIAQHFVTAFLDLHLKGDESRLKYLDLIEDSNEGVWAMENGTPKPEHNYWAGFNEGTAVGMKFETLQAK